MKIPIIPPLLYKNCFITDFKEKAKLFFLNNASLFVIIAFFLLMSTILLTNAYLQLHFQPKVLKKVIQNLDSNKAHGHDNIGIRMLKICRDSTCVPSEMTFNSALNLTSVFHSKWKKDILFPFT